MKALLPITLLLAGCVTTESAGSAWLVGPWCPEPDTRPPLPDGLVYVGLFPARFHADGRVTGFELEGTWRLSGNRLEYSTQGAVSTYHDDRVERLGRDRMAWTKNHSWRTLWRRCPERE
ncbi:MAG TPA: hypothetical protein VEX35_10070 [Allosphingosinicella sp.]|nr:hypothetical protein [Allosphingosinicella sp.]